MDSYGLADFLILAAIWIGAGLMGLAIGWFWRSKSADAIENQLHQQIADQQKQVRQVLQDLRSRRL